MTKMPNYISTTNACKLCKPLGASIAFRGVEGSVPFLHGSQGCATYMRRYIISHFNEPIDIASSSLGEKNAIYGGGPNLKLGLKNVTEKYRPQVIGIATTCLTETIGDDVKMLVTEYQKEFSQDGGPALVRVSTPSYSGSHMEGFHAATLAMVEQLATESGENESFNLFPGFVSPADIRLLKETVATFSLPVTILPDYSDTLDGQALCEYPLIPEGGTPIASIRRMAGAKGSIELGTCLPDLSGGSFLAETSGNENFRLTMPIGLRATDSFLALLEKISSRTIPASHTSARGRLVDTMVDGHKYISGKRALVYGEEDLVVGLTSFLSEIGIQPVVCASGGKSGKFRQAIASVTRDLLLEEPLVIDGVDFFDIAETAAELKPDIIIGHSKGYPLARKLSIPIIRVGFPIHDRVGGQRILHFGYQGAQALFDTIVNAIIEKKQNDSNIGYSYM